MSEQELIRELAKLLDETGLSEIEVEREGVRVRVARQSVTHVVSGSAHVPPLPATAPAPATIALEVADLAKHPGVVINPAGYTTTSVAILDAIFAVQLPTVEVHITNIHQREEYRHHSYISKGAKAVICGFGVEGYALAIHGLASLIGAKAK